MELRNVKIIEELEACKDILWFLKGYTKSNENSYITILHVAALSDVINELQTRILNDIPKGIINENIHSWDTRNLI